MNIIKLFDELYSKYGHQHWWPRILPEDWYFSKNDSTTVAPAALAFNNRHLTIGKMRGKPVDHRFEIAVGAILTQNVSWKNVETALERMFTQDLMSPPAIARCRVSKLEKCIYSTRYYSQKTRKLKEFSQWLIDNYQGRLEVFRARPIVLAREELLNLWGIGQETADSILLYACGKPVFVIDAYTKRICKECGVIFKNYDEYQDYFVKAINQSWSKILAKKTWPHSKVKFYNELHALIVRWGYEH